MTRLPLRRFENGLTDSNGRLPDAGGKYGSDDKHCPIDSRAWDQQPDCISGGDKSVERALRETLASGLRP
ncbi:MAG: hypothetical protein M3Y93_13260, partial [Pseudomonadota bacterium]|nr:hypothetical protein [Pseudomonadota bacterium]